MNNTLVILKSTTEELKKRLTERLGFKTSTKNAKLSTPASKKNNKSQTKINVPPPEKKI